MSDGYPHPLIAREGWPYLAGTTLVAVLVAAVLSLAWSLPFFALALFVLQFFRDPPRAVPQQAGVLLAPADGRVVKVTAALDPYTERETVLVSVFMNVFNVHSNRSPVDATVERVAYAAGKFFNADLDKASTDNERNAVILRLGSGERCTVVQVAGLIARRILCYVRAGDELRRGQRYGFIRFGSRVDVYLPPGARPCVAVGDTVWATTTILAELGPAAAAAGGDR